MLQRVRRLEIRIEELEKEVERLTQERDNALGKAMELAHINTQIGQCRDEATVYHIQDHPATRLKRDTTPAVKEVPPI